MYYRQALILQCFLEYAGDNGQLSILFQILIQRYGRSHSFKNEVYIVFLAAIFDGYRTRDFHERDTRNLVENAEALADLKFIYVVSCQAYGSQKKSKNPRDRRCYNNILSLMLE